MANSAAKRIMREIQEMKSDPSPDYTASPLEDNMFEWHFTIRGANGTDFEGGIYHGRIILPADYPFKPPNIVLLTPNGRFQEGAKICLSISAHHPETWMPSWSIRTVLVALIGFMPTEANGAAGAVEYPPQERRSLAMRSLHWSCSKCGVHNRTALPKVEQQEKKDMTKDDGTSTTSTTSTSSSNSISTLEANNGDNNVLKENNNDHDNDKEQPIDVSTSSTTLEKEKENKDIENEDKVININTTTTETTIASTPTPTITTQQKEKENEISSTSSLSSPSANTNTNTNNSSLVREDNIVGNRTNNNNTINNNTSGSTATTTTTTIKRNIGSVTNTNANTNNNNNNNNVTTTNQNAPQVNQVVNSPPSTASIDRLIIIVFVIFLALLYKKFFY